MNFKLQLIPKRVFKAAPQSCMDQVLDAVINVSHTDEASPNAATEAAFLCISLPLTSPQLGAGCCSVSSSLHGQHRDVIKYGKPSGKQWKVPFCFV